MLAAHVPLQMTHILLKMNECCKLSMFAAHVPLQMTHILKHKLTKVALDMYGCSACASSNDSHT